MLAALSMLWGWSFPLNSLAVRGIPPVTLALLRVSVAAAVLLAVMRGLRLSVPRAAWPALAGMGLLNNALPFVLIMWGQQGNGSALASVLNASTPLFGVLVAHVLLPDERMTPAKASGVAVGFAGVAVMVGPGVEGHGVLPPLACLGGAVSYAFAGVYGRRFRQMGLAPLATATGQVCASALMLLPVALVVDRPWGLLPPGPAAWGSVLAVGVFCTALAYLLYFRILAAVGAVNLLLVTLLVPVSAVLLGVGVLGEVLQGRHLAGMGLVAAGLVLLDGRVVRRFL